MTETQQLPRSGDNWIKAALEEAALFLFFLGAIATIATVYGATVLVFALEKL